MIFRLMTVFLSLLAVRVQCFSSIAPKLSPEYSAIKNLKVLKPSSMKETETVEISSLWNDNERTMMILFRSFG